jgi:predicted adenine nucleotide alpha hydrolase (AANH) superfamily ATPase
MKKILLHSCCGPCFMGAICDPGLSDFEIIGYYYNPNIQPKEEYEKRLNYFKKASFGKLTRIITEEYDRGKHLLAVKGFEKDPGTRCLLCYKLRLTKTAKLAKKEGIDTFSTTLLVSPYQNHDALKKIGEEVACSHGLNFYYQDMRPYFRTGQDDAKKCDIYRQKYCGCLFSKDER